MLSVAALLRAAAIGVFSAAVAAQSPQFGELPRHEFPHFDLGLTPVFGDFDGDGDRDMVMPAARAPSRLYLNDGSGTFEDRSAGRLPGTIWLTTAMAAGDVDGDGDLDLVVGNNFEPNRLYLNDGAGMFSDATASRLPSGVSFTQALALADVDRDGDLDLVVASFQLQSRLYLNNGTGTFTDATDARMPLRSDPTWALQIGDLDRDGDPDLVLGCLGGQCRLYLNDGTGGFLDATARLPVGIHVTRSLALGDVDRDGDLDLILGNSFGHNRLYLNDGSGSFVDGTASRLPLESLGTTSVEFGDVDGDGDLDLIAANGAPSSFTPGPGRIYVNDGTGSFTDETTSRVYVDHFFGWSLALGDVDRDGDLDAFLGSSSVSRLLMNRGDGRFVDASAPRLPVGSFGTASLAAGDVDGDGDLDLFLGDTNSDSVGGSRLCINDGRAFTNVTGSRFPVGFFQTTAVAFSDIDRDGDLDLVRGSNDGSRIYVNDGRGTFVDGSFLALPDTPGAYALAVGDVDGDGYPDLVLGNHSGAAGQCRLYTNNGIGRFADATAGRMPTGRYSTAAIALGDVDADGDLDMVLGNTGTTGGQSRLYLNSGTGSFSDATASHMPPGMYSTSSLALGDVDRDGDLDLVLGNQGFASRSRLYLNGGTGIFADMTASHLPLAQHSTTTVCLGDLDGDGDFDLVLGGTSDSARLYLNNGAGVFAVTSNRLPAESRMRVLLLADLDRDGDLDMVVGRNESRDSLYFNLRGQLDAPNVLRLGRDYQLDVYSRYATSAATEIAFPFLSAGTASIRLPALGHVGLDPTQMVALAPFVVPQPAGVGSTLLRVPQLGSIAGLSFHTQALLVDSLGQARLTNTVSDVMLR